MVEFIDKVVSYLNGLFSGVLNTLVLVLVILLVGFVLGRLVGRLVGRLLHEFEVDNVLHKAGFKVPVEQSLAALLSYLIYFVAVALALAQLGLTTFVLYIIVGGAVLLILVATVLGIKDFIPNLIAGFFIFRKGLFHEDQIILFKNIEGKVKRISIIETEIETKTGDMVYVPNSLLVKSTLLVRKKK
ncbi:MAG TPA: mechanosensitive ion channel domain-containing protein [Candidatus Nanoarchaeia archaeon]|nr:mechanosensitive ion channel domain-containing protein [Candidatus Nanoarchaeia archaeon]